MRQMIPNIAFLKLSGIQLLAEIPALSIKRTLVVADLHIGFAANLFRYSLRARERISKYQVLSMIHAISSVAEKHYDKLVIVGDVKDSIGMPRKFILNAIDKFFSKVGEFFKRVVIVRGNHDGALLDLIDKLNLNVDLTDHLILHDQRAYIVLTHGHMKLPYSDYAKSDLIITGHLHPATQLDKPFVVCTYKVKESIKKTLIIIPALNPKVWGTAVNCDAIYSLLRTIIPKNFQSITIEDANLIGRTTLEKMICEQELGLTHSPLLNDKKARTNSQ